jgi:glucan 1,3-beta-glucosidase
MEPFITPSYYQKYTGAVDEFTLSTLMSADTGAGGGLQQLEAHYETFIVSSYSISSFVLPLFSSLSV